VLRLGTLKMVGDTSIEQSVPLAGLKQQPRRAMLNYYDDVLSSGGN
jgi:hypothetical protein